MARTPNTQLAEIDRKLQACQQTMRILFAAEDSQNARIARMLHDNVAQCVAALQLGFRGLERELDAGGDPRLTLQSLHAITQSVSEELHRTMIARVPADSEG